MTKTNLPSSQAQRSVNGPAPAQSRVVMHSENKIIKLFCTLLLFILHALQTELFQTFIQVYGLTLDERHIRGSEEECWTNQRVCFQTKVLAISVQQEANTHKAHR